MVLIILAIIVISVIIFDQLILIFTAEENQYTCTENVRYEHDCAANQKFFSMPVFDWAQCC